MAMATKPPMAPTTAPITAPRFSFPILGSLGSFMNSGDKLSLCERHVGTRLRSSVFSGRADQSVVFALFGDVRRPAGRAGDDEDGREHRRRDAAKVVGQRAVKI